MGICTERSVSIARGTLCLFTHANERRQSRKDRLDSREAALVDTEEDLLEGQGQSQQHDGGSWPVALLLTQQENPVVQRKL